MKRLIYYSAVAAALGGLLQGQTINVSSGSVTKTGPLSNNSSGLNGGAPDLVKTGSGELILRGNNESGSGSAFTGTAYINAGTLTVSGSFFSPGGRAIPDASQVAVASGAKFQVKWSESIGSLTGLGRVDVVGSRLTVLGAGTFSGTLNNKWAILGASTEFRNGAAVENGLITNEAFSGVIFDAATASGSSIHNDGVGSYARFEDGSLVLNTDVVNGGLASNVLFDASTAEGSTITNEEEGSFTRFDNGSLAQNTLISNEGLLTSVVFHASTAECSTILNGPAGTYARFDNGAQALNTHIVNGGALSSVEFDGSTADGSTIENEGEGSFARFEDGAVAQGGSISNLGLLSSATFSDSTADGVSITNGGALSGATFIGATAGNGTTIDNQGETSYVAFLCRSTADNATIFNTGCGSSAWFSGGSSIGNCSSIRNEGAGSSTTFTDSSAGEVTITNVEGAGAVTRFQGESTGSSETTIENGAGGLLDISGLTVPSLTIGRLYGDGDIELGSNDLSVGSQNHEHDVIGGSISGDGGSFTKQGTGTLVLTGSSSVGVVVRVEEGTLELNGSFAAVDGFQVNAGSVLKGNGVFQGDVFNDGSVEPGNSPGVLTVVGNYVQSSVGTFQLEIAGYHPALFDRLVVGGRADLDGTLDVVPYAPVSRFFYGDRVDFLHADGGIFGTFSRVLVPNPNRFRGRFFKPDANTGSLVIAPASYTLVAHGPNDLSLARALDHWIGVETGDIGEVTLALDLLREEEYAGAFAAIEPGYYAGALNTQLETAHAVGRMLNLQLGSRRLGAAVDASGKAVVTGKEVVQPGPALDFWVQGSGVFSSGGLSLLPGAELDSGNLLVGGSVAISPALALGFFGDFGEGWTDVAGNGNIDYDRSLFGGYATYDAGRFYAFAAAGGGAVDFEIDRPIQFGTLSRRASSKPESEEFLGLMTVGYEMPAGPSGWYLEPQASLQYSSAELRSLTETGADALNLHVEDAAADSLRTYVGGRLARRFMLKSGAVLTPFLHAHWVHEHLREGDFFHANLDGGAGPGFRYILADPAQNSLYGGAGLNLWSRKGLNIHVDYNVDWGRSNPDHGVALGVGKAF